MKNIWSTVKRINNRKTLSSSQTFSSQDTRAIISKRKRFDGSGLSQKNTVDVSHEERLTFAATHSKTAVLGYVQSSQEGLTEREVINHRARYGTNYITHKREKSPVHQLIEAFINPFTAILFVLAIISGLNDVVFPLLSMFDQTPDDCSYTTVVIIVVMVTISGLLRFIQELKSNNAVHQLMVMIKTTCSVLRKGDTDQPTNEQLVHRETAVREIPLDELVVGDLIYLSTGDMVPADVRLIETHDLFVNQASLTGESEPAEKIAATQAHQASVTDYVNIAFMGTNVISGSGWAIVVSTGIHTLFGSMTRALDEKDPQTSFAKGVNAVSWVLIRFMLVMVPIVLMINGFTKGDWVAASLFAISVAVGLTPEMLPMIVTTCLAKGAVLMSKKQTIVKNLNSIQNFGAMDILCTDKTGTLTQNDVVLEYHLNIHGEDDLHVLRSAYLNSYFQTGYKNLMDAAIIKKTEEVESADKELEDLSEAYTKLDEIPFDFKRRRLSVVVRGSEGSTVMVTKGAVEEMLSICTQVRDADAVKDLTAEVKTNILHMVSCLNDRGFRVLALAVKDNPSPVGAFNVSDECSMCFLGILAFLDPPKESVASTLAALRSHGVTTKILTGDNTQVTRTICKAVGLEVSSILEGSDIEDLSDTQLCERAQTTTVFAKLTPEQKARIVRVLRECGHTVGYMGDGINDAAAMKQADIGISVDSAVDVAKESADIILLQKDLGVLEQGIIGGRKTFANMVKYIKMTASSNFGNVLSVLISSAMLPFLPMQSIQLILLNLIYDLSCTAIPWDGVDREMIERPRAWNASSIGKFMICFGPISSIFDVLTFAVMFLVICPLCVSGGIVWWDLPSVYSGAQLTNVRAAYCMLFQTGWFVESMWSQTLVIHMIRTSKIPFIQSNASWQLTLCTSCAIALLTLIPFSPLGAVLGLCPLPLIYFAYLAICVLLYMVLTTLCKKLYIHHYGELL